MNSTSTAQQPAPQHGSHKWFRMALLYFVIAVCMGVVMGATQDHRLMSVHAHLNLLGWVTMSLMGAYYHFFPAQARNKIASAHFWMHQLALPVMMLALTLRILGNEAAEPVIGIGSIVVLLSVLMFAFNMLRAMNAPAANAITTAPYTVVQGATA